MKLSAAKKTSRMQWFFDDGKLKLGAKETAGMFVEFAAKWYNEEETFTVINYNITSAWKEVVKWVEERLNANNPKTNSTSYSSKQGGAKRETSISKTLASGLSVLSSPAPLKENIKSLLTKSRRKMPFSLRKSMKQ